MRSLPLPPTGWTWPTSAKGQFEGLAEKMKDPLWKPDFGPDTHHPTGGATAHRGPEPLICFNINLDTPNVEIARQIAAGCGTSAAACTM